MDAIAFVEGVVGNGLTTTETLGSGSWGAATLLGGLNAVDYWFIRVDDNEAQLAVSKANALTGTQIDLTAAGEGTTSVDGFAGVLESPAASVTDGNGSFSLPANSSVVLSAPLEITAAGFTAASVLTYWWL